MIAAEETHVYIESVTRATPHFSIPDWMLEEDEAIRLGMRLLLICARVGVVEWRGDRYALTWDMGEK